MSQELLWFYVVKFFVSLHCFETNVVVHKRNLFSKTKGALSKLPHSETKRTLTKNKALAAEDSCTLVKVLKLHREVKVCRGSQLQLKLHAENIFTSEYFKCIFNG